MTAFFLPGVDSDDQSAEDVYAGIRSQTHAETGHQPHERRIFRLAFRNKGKDVEAEVGQPDPILGQTVLAILDIGRDRPYVIHCAGNGATATQVLAARPVYSVTEFGP